MIEDLNIDSDNQIIVEDVIKKYSWTGITRLPIYPDAQYSVEGQVGKAFDNNLSKPMLVLINDYNSTLGKYNNVFAVVFTYSGGTVYYASPFTRGSGNGLWDNLSDLSLSEFVEKAQAAIDGSNVRIMKF